MNFLVLIIDDELLARQIIRNYLKAYPDMTIAGECDNGLDAVQMIHDLKPDVIFLDIQMPELSGIEVLERLEYMPQIVFSTAFDEYAIRAFEINAVDYLLKPYDEDRFRVSIERIRNEAGNNQLPAESLMSLMQSFKKAEYPERLLLPDNKKMIFVPVKDIQYIEAQENYVSVATDQNMYLVFQRLSELETKLDPQLFFRIHRSYVVNINHVASVQTYLKGSSEVILNNDKKLPLSRRRVHELKERFGM